MHADQARLTLELNTQQASCVVGQALKGFVRADVPWAGEDVVVRLVFERWGDHLRAPRRRRVLRHQRLTTTVGSRAAVAFTIPLPFGPLPFEGDVVHARWLIEASCVANARTHNGRAQASIQEVLAVRLPRIQPPRVQTSTLPQHVHQVRILDALVDWHMRLRPGALCLGNGDQLQWSAEGVRLVDSRGDTLEWLTDTSGTALKLSRHVRNGFVQHGLTLSWRTPEGRALRVSAQALRSHELEGLPWLDVRGADAAWESVIDFIVTAHALGASVASWPAAATTPPLGCHPSKVSPTSPLSLHQLEGLSDLTPLWGQVHDNQPADQGRVELRWIADVVWPLSWALLLSLALILPFVLPVEGRTLALPLLGGCLVVGLLIDALEQPLQRGLQAMVSRVLRRPWLAITSWPTLALGDSGTIQVSLIPRRDLRVEAVSWELCREEVLADVHVTPVTSGVALHTPERVAAGTHWRLAIPITIPHDAPPSTMSVDVTACQHQWRWRVCLHTDQGLLEASTYVCVLPMHLRINPSPGLAIPMTSG